MFIQELIISVLALEEAKKIIEIFFPVPPYKPWRFLVAQNTYRDLVAWLNGGFWDTETKSYCFDSLQKIEHFAFLINSELKPYIIVDSIKRQEKDLFANRSNLWQHLSRIKINKLDLEIEYYILGCYLSRALNLPDNWQSSLLLVVIVSTITDEAHFIVINPNSPRTMTSIPSKSVIITNYLEKTEENLETIAREAFNRYCLNLEK